MCIVSNIGEIFIEELPKRYPSFAPNPGALPSIVWQDVEARQQLAELKKEMQEIKELLKAAKKYDEATGQKDCEMEAKIQLLKHFADVVGISLEEVFNSTQK